MIQTRIKDSYTEIYTDGGGNSWITEAKPTCYRTFSKQRPLIGSQTEADFTEWTDAEKAAWEANPPKPAERNAMTPVYEATGAKLNEATGYYEMYNAIFDLTENDMAAVVEAGFPPAGGEGYYCANRPNLRVNARPHGNTRSTFANTWRNDEHLEVYSNSGFTGGSYAFAKCIRLHTMTLFHAYDDQSNSHAFQQCISLKRCLCSLGKGGGVSFADSPLIDTESLTHMATTCVAPADRPAKVILHPKAYARVTDEIAATALAKNLTFMCAAAHCDGSAYTEAELA